MQRHSRRSCGRKVKPLGKLRIPREGQGKPLIVRLAFRSRAHNHAVGGAPNSKHTDGSAFVIAMTNQGPMAFEAAAPTMGFPGVESHASHE